MRKYIMLVPLPMGGLALSIVSLASLLVERQRYITANILIAISSVVWVLLLMKCLFLNKERHELRHPIIASVLPTISMASLALMSQFNRLSGGEFQPLIGKIWLVFCLLQYAWLIYFSYRFVWQETLEIKKVFPSWFIVYVGIGIIASTGMSFYPLVAKVSLAIALLLYVFLLPVIIYRVFVHKKFEDSEWPLVTILAAPGSLCLVGYLKAVANPSFAFATGLFILSQGLYWLVIFLISRKKLEQFYPSFSAYTFPLVISATASYVYTETFLTGHSKFLIFSLLGNIELFIATAVVFFVFCHYFLFLRKQIRLLRKA